MAKKNSCGKKKIQIQGWGPDIQKYEQLGKKKFYSKIVKYFVLTGRQTYDSTCIQKYLCLKEKIPTDFAYKSLPVRLKHISITFNKCTVSYSEKKISLHENITRKIWELIS